MISDLSSLIKNITKPVVDFVFPRICLISDERLSDENTNDFIQDGILKNLETIKEDELPFQRAKINADFFYTKYAFKKDNEIQILTHYLKYKNFTKIGIFLGEIIGKDLIRKYETRLKEFDCVMPVPLYGSKFRERGYNQSTFIAQGIHNVTKIPILDENIIRVKNTKSQTGLTYKQRIENVKDAFAINKKNNNQLKSNGILIVDDVMTTGSTIKEIIRTIKQHTSIKVGATTVSLAKD